VVAQSIVAYVDTALDGAEIGRIHRRVFAIVTAGLFFDVIDFIILGSLVPDMVRSNFATPAQIGTVGTAQIIGLFIGAIGQGEFTDRLGASGSTRRACCSTALRRLRQPWRPAPFGSPSAA
jgi:MFS family permease